ncbi:MAG: formimidoylglutamase [Nitrospinota bacterium]|nr:formimidoylglutamase [Nitrospinota bacterium]
MSDDPRLADIIRHGQEGTVVLLGFPYDAGVAINGGRPGACHGPEKFRSWIGRYGTADNPEWNIDLTRITIGDAGDIPADLPLDQSHTALTEKTASIIQNGGIPFVVGGGNDQSWPNARALLDSKPDRSIGVINIDAHLDVRPLKDGQAHSGSPFRLLLEDPRFSGSQFIEFAAQGSQVSREHANYVREREGQIIWYSEVARGDAAAQAFRSALGRLAWECDSLFVSFDLDSIRSSDAPGVSCPGIMGLRAKEAFEMAFNAGAHPKVDLFDLSEYNPLIEDERTGRLAVGIFYHFCLGVASRRGVS